MMENIGQKTYFKNTLAHGSLKSVRLQSRCRRNCACLRVLCRVLSLASSRAFACSPEASVQECPDHTALGVGWVARRSLPARLTVQPPLPPPLQLLRGGAVVPVLLQRPSGRVEALVVANGQETTTTSHNIRNHTPRKGCKKARTNMEEEKGRASQNTAETRAAQQREETLFPPAVNQFKY